MGPSFAIFALLPQLRLSANTLMADAMADPRILCLIDTVGKGGGAEHLVGALAPRMAALGARIEVAALHEWPINLADEIEAAGVTVHRIGASHARVTPTSMARVARLVRNQPFDVYWGHLRTGNIHARLAAGLTGGRSVATLHSEGYMANPPRRLRDRIAVGWEGMVLGSMDARVGVSNAVARDYEAYFGWRDVAVAYNGIDVERIVALGGAEAPLAARARHGIGDDEFLIVTAARYVPKKGQSHLVEAVARLRQGGIGNIRLFLCGEGDTAALLRQAADLGVAAQVTGAGVLDQSELMPLIGAADAYVMPSLREPFGIAAAEAMALGVPTVLTQVDGFLELVGESGVALMARPADAASLADCIARIHADPAAARAMGGKAAARMAERFSLDACARRWIEIFDAIHAGRAIPPCAA